MWKVEFVTYLVVFHCIAKILHILDISKCPAETNLDKIPPPPNIFVANQLVICNIVNSLRVLSVQFFFLTSSNFLKFLTLVLKQS